MIKKLPKIFLIPIVIITIIFIVGAFLRKDITISNVSSDCRKNPCTIEFGIENKTNDHVLCKVSIRAHKSTPGAKSSGVVTPGFAGEKIIELKLYPKEKLEIKESLLLTGRKSRIIVNAFNINKLSK
jgi:hypothetical protein